MPLLDAFLRKPDTPGTGSADASSPHSIQPLGYESPDNIALAWNLTLSRTVSSTSKIIAIGLLE